MVIEFTFFTHLMESSNFEENGPAEHPNISP